MKYTDEQLSELSENLDSFEALKSVFDAICDDSEAELNMKEIGEKTSLSTYPRDKAILALEFAGLIEKKDRGTNKVYKLTDQGKRMNEMRRTK